MHYKEGNMKKALIAMLLMAIFLIGGGGLVSMLFTHALGGGVEQSYIYPYLWRDNRADRSYRW